VSLDAEVDRAADPARAAGPSGPTATGCPVHGVDPPGRRFARPPAEPGPRPEPAVGVPAGPRRPAVAQTLEWVIAPDRFMRRNSSRFGDRFTARLGPATDVVFLSSPSAVKAVFHGPPEHMNMGDINGLFRRVLGRNSLLVLDGDEHLRQRKLLLPPFHGARIADHHGAMRTAAEDDVAAWPVGRAFPLQPRMQAMTLNVILRAVFGLEAGARRDRLRALLARLLELNTTIATTLPQLRIELGGRTPWGKLMRCTAEVDRAVYAEIARRREQPDARGDVLSLLLGARDEAGEPLSDRELRDQLLTMLVAGHETTATALAWAFELILRQPHVVARIRSGLAAGDPAYLDAAIKESLRLRPVVPITARKLTVPYEVDGTLYPAGTVLMPCIYLLHRNPEIYEAPDEFRPERFIGEQPPPYAYIPFGGGVRRCLGAGFALAEMRAVMSTVFERVELEPAAARPERIVRRAFTLSPRDGARVVVKRRLG
jgi:cytochrome P450